MTKFLNAFGRGEISLLDDKLTFKDISFQIEMNSEHKKSPPTFISLKSVVLLLRDLTLGPSNQFDFDMTVARQH